MISHVWDRNWVFKSWVEEGPDPDGNTGILEDWDPLWPSVSLSKRAEKNGGGCGEEDGVGGDLTGETGPNFKGGLGKEDEDSSGRDTRQTQKDT